MQPSTHQKESDNQFIELLRNRDPFAFEALLDEYGEDLFKMVFSVIKDEDNTKDVIQDFFYDLLNEKKSLYIEGSVRNYVFAALRNRALNYLRNNARRLKVTESVDLYTHHLDMQSGRQTGHPMEVQEFTNRVMGEINRLPENVQNIFKLSREEGLTNLQIAAHTGLSHKTVRNRVSMALKILRARLSDVLLLTLLMDALLAFQ